jgi:hypothetical protein
VASRPAQSSIVRLPSNQVQMNSVEVSLSPLPPMRELRSPEVVRVLDAIRNELDDSDHHAEFSWFAREYPRCYRYHLDAADYRLRTIHQLLTEVGSDLAKRVESDDGKLVEASIGGFSVNRIYWDFESYLANISTALDLLARIVGPAFSEQRPVSFSKFCTKLSDNEPFLKSFLRARSRWVLRMKDYRDCFVHYTPVDTLLMVGIRRSPRGWELRAKLPTNPNVREIMGFRYSQRVELLRYACTLHRHMTALDRAVAREIYRLFKNRGFPIRGRELFFIGGRSR